jgi:hypothetical protein
MSYRQRACRPLPERFWPHVNKTDSCWLWTAGQSHGYGTIGYGHGSITTHRASWLIHFGELPAKHVLHHCDTPLCVNPDHLYLGDDKDNHRDMVERGRSNKGRRLPHANVPRGEASHWSKLTESQVLEIRRRIKAGEKPRTIAPDFGITKQYVGVLKHYWKHLN